MLLCLDEAEWAACGREFAVVDDVVAILLLGLVQNLARAARPNPALPASVLNPSLCQDSPA